MPEDLLKSLYKLSSNPFSQRANPSAPMAGRTEESSEWTKVIEKSIGQRGSSLTFIIGDYGLGKSHSLYQIKKLCDSRDDVTAVFIKLMAEDPVKNFGLEFIRRIFKNLPDKAIAKLAKAPPPPTKHRDHLPHYNVINKFAKNLFPYKEVLTGGVVSAADLKKADIKHPPKSAEVAFEYLNMLLVMLRSVDICSLVLCVDEAEYIFSQLTATKAAWVFNALRSMYDLPDAPNLGHEYRDIANIVFFFALSTSGYQSLQRMERVESRQGGPIQPLLTRKERDINLKLLTEVETKDLVETYLRTNRSTGKKEKDPLIPYDEGFVDYVYSLTNGHPRQTIERCDYVLVEGLQARVPILTKKYAKEVFQRLGMAA